MARSSSLDDPQSLESKINAKAGDLFREKPGQAPLQVNRIFKRMREEGGVERNCFERNLDVNDLARVEALKNDHDDSTQIFVIRHARQWSTLHTSRDMVEGFMSIYNVMPTFWKHIFTFGRKSEEHEYQFPHSSRRRSRGATPNIVTHELAYMLRRVEHINREVDVGESPWCTMQTAIYHQFLQIKDEPDSHSERFISKPTGSKSVFLLIEPSKRAETQFGLCLDRDKSDQSLALSPWKLHRILVEDSLRAWADYMDYLDRRLGDESNALILATVGKRNAADSLLPTYLTISFEDRQEIKIFEDLILDLQIILPSMLEAITSIHKQLSLFRHTSQGFSKEQLWDMDTIIDEFSEHIRDAKMHVQRAITLKDSSTSITRLIAELLSLQEANTMKKLTVETQIESKLMRHLAEKSTKDAAAVKILTVITLIYLPTTIVANFFSTQFVQTKEDGHMHVAPNVWILAAISVPLTVITLLIWWGWVRFTESRLSNDPTQTDIVPEQQPSFWYKISGRRKQKKQLAYPESTWGRPPLGSSNWSNSGIRMTSIPR